MDTKKIHIAYSERIDWISKLTTATETSTKPKTKFERGVIQQNILTKHLSKRLFVLTRVNIDDLESFLNQVQNSVVCDPHTITMSTMYFERVVKIVPNYVSNYKNLFCICIILAMKMNEDRFFKNKTIFEKLPLDGMDLKQMNQMEREILRVLEYELIIELKVLYDFLFKPLCK